VAGAWQSRWPARRPTGQAVCSGQAVCLCTPGIWVNIRYCRDECVLRLLVNIRAITSM
jgi:hypothetical protein